MTVFFFCEHLSQLYTVVSCFVDTRYHIVFSLWRLFYICKKEVAVLYCFSVSDGLEQEIAFTFQHTLVVRVVSKCSVIHGGAVGYICLQPEKMVHTLILSPAGVNSAERCPIKVFLQKNFLNYSKIICWAVRHGHLVKLILTILRS